MKIPVSIIEDHSDCLFQLQRLLGRNKLPLSGFAMLHFDSHPDMCASPDFREENLENAQKMREKVSIESWILPLVVAGHLKKIIWVRPPWGDQLPDGIKTLHCGFSNDLITGKPTRLSVSWPTEYYTSDGTFSKTEDIISHSSPFDFMTILAQNFEAQPQFINESWFLDVDLV